MMLICLILSIAVLVWLIYRFTRPLRQLAESMRQAGGGEFGRLIPTSSSDVEILPVIDQFNTMTTLINQLFNETYRLKLEQQRAELRALQAQINPHFLYNTLQTIHFMALKRNAYEISAIVDSLGSILRYCLKFGEDEVPLEAEIQNISQYLTVQKMRFLNRLSTHLDVDDRVKDVMIPKMILQPLVENCIVHGVQDSAKSCTIRISCFLKGEQVVIEVRDDGPGIPEARLLDIRRSLDAAEGDQSDDHIGVINCYLRLKYFFQGKAEFEIESAPGKGTLVRIVCPARRV
jgi:two-component system sensor histidine kinase YesM